MQNDLIAAYCIIEVCQQLLLWKAIYISYINCAAIDWNGLVNVFKPIAMRYTEMLYSYHKEVRRLTVWQ